MTFPLSSHRFFVLNRYTCFYKNTEFVNKWCVSFKELKDFHDAGNPQSVNGHQVLQAVPATVPAYESQPVGKY